MNMLKILTVFFYFFVLTPGFDFPGKFSYEDVASQWQHRHLLNMTENLIKDAMYKLRQADVVQTIYRHTSGYELGLIAAGIMEHYRHMIVVYRYFSNAQDFKNHTHDIRQIMTGYSVIQSDYNEMLHETVLFYKVLDVHLRIQTAERSRARKLARKYKLSYGLMLQMIRAGIEVEDVLERGQKRRRMMRVMKGTGFLNDTSLDVDSMESEAFANKMRRIFEENGLEGFDFPKEISHNDWTKKNGNNTKEAEYKKSLRYKMWADKWDGFNPDIEGVNIPDKIAGMGLRNASDFFMKELKEDFL